MAAMLVPLPETSSDSNTLVLGHYPASSCPMTNSSGTPFLNRHPQNLSIRRPGRAVPGAGVLGGAEKQLT
jgi:hypothetical protein